MISRTISQSRCNLARGLVTLEQGIDDDGVLVHQCQRL